MIDYQLVELKQIFAALYPNANVACVESTGKLFTPAHIRVTYAE